MFFAEELSGAVEQYLSGLPEREAEALRRLFGINTRRPQTKAHRLHAQVSPRL